MLAQHSCHRGALLCGEKDRVQWLFVQNRQVWRERCGTVGYKKQLLVLDACDICFRVRKSAPLVYQVIFLICGHTIS